MDFVLKYLFAALFSLVVTVLVTPVLMRVARGIGLLDHPRANHEHPRPVPLCGGFSILIGLHLTAAVMFALKWHTFSGHLGLGDWVHLLVGSILIVALGAVDDKVELSPRFKLLGQFVIATLLFGLGARFGTMLNAPLQPVLSYVCTVFWFVGAMNAFNLIDGMDGVAAGLGFIGALGLGVLACFTQQLSDALLMVALAGSCLAFLRYNFYPAKAFLGDSGSMLIGLTLAWFSLKTNTKSPTVMALLVPVLAIGVPFLDVFLAVWRRFVLQLIDGSHTGTGVFVGDHDHLHHRLMAFGLSQRAVAGALYAMALALVSAGLLATFLSSHRAGILMAAFAAFSYVVIRHLARIELLQSGRLASQGLQKPTSKVVAVILYPCVDVFVLMVSFLIVVILLGDALSVHGVKHVWRYSAPVGVGLPFLALAFSRTYLRVWSRARISEYGQLILWLVVGIVAGAATLQLFYAFSPTSMFLCVFIYLGVALPSIVLARAFPRVLQDFAMVFSGLQGRHKGGGTLIYGAGYTATLFIRQRVHRGAERRKRRLLGFVDDDRNLWGRIVYGFPVLGGLEDIDTIAKERDIGCLVVTYDVPASKRDYVLELAKKHHFEVQCWQPEVKTCFTPSAANRNGLST